MKRILIVGQGSIGRRHVEVSRCVLPAAEVTPISSRYFNEQDDASISEILSTVDAAIIASPAPLHVCQSEPFLQKGLPTLIEKPLSVDYSSTVSLAERHGVNQRVAVAYVLRFMPVLQRCKRLLEARTLGELHYGRFHVSQFLPDWRLGADYRQSVSAQKALGGGVLLELSHEIDLILWLLGGVKEVCADVVNTRTLAVDVEDQADVMMRLDGCVSVNLHMDFMQRVTRREVFIAGECGSIRVDLLTQRIEICLNDSRQWSEVPCPVLTQRNELYIKQMRAFAAIERECWPGASLQDGVSVMKVIDAIRRAAAQNCWVSIDEK